MWSAYSTYGIQFYQRISAFRVGLAMPRLLGGFEMRYLIRYFNLVEAYQGRLSSGGRLRDI
jgi:hypothetical protein